jgi:hypothetical protein
MALADPSNSGISRHPGDGRVPPQPRIDRMAAAAILNHAPHPFSDQQSLRSYARLRTTTTRSSTVNVALFCEAYRVVYSLEPRLEFVGPVDSRLKRFIEQ